MLKMAFKDVTVFSELSLVNGKHQVLLFVITNMSSCCICCKVGVDLCNILFFNF